MGPGRSLESDHGTEGLRISEEKIIERGRFN